MVLQNISLQSLSIGPVRIGKTPVALTVLPDRNQQTGSSVATSFLGRLSELTGTHGSKPRGSGSATLPLHYWTSRTRRLLPTFVSDRWAHPMTGPRCTVTQVGVDNTELPSVEKSMWSPETTQAELIRNVSTVNTAPFTKRLCAHDMCCNKSGCSRVASSKCQPSTRPACHRSLPATSGFDHKHEIQDRVLLSLMPALAIRVGGLTYDIQCPIPCIP